MEEQKVICLSRYCFRFSVGPSQKNGQKTALQKDSFPAEAVKGLADIDEGEITQRNSQIAMEAKYPLHQKPCQPVSTVEIHGMVFFKVSLARVFFSDMVL